MKNEQEKVINFKLDELNGLTITHGYNIVNSFPVHFHSTYNLGVIELGRREFNYRGALTELKQNDVFIIQPFEPHSCKSINGEPHSYKIVSLDFDYKNYFPQLIINDAKLQKTLTKFHALAEYNKNSPELNEAYFLIIKTLREYSTQTNEIHNIEYDLSAINQAKKFIENNCLLEISLDEMAEQAFLSAYHFNRIFHKYYGLSPYAYYLLCKIKKSQNTLLTLKSVTETAYETGFFDQSHFTKLFRKHVGVSPGRYLKQNIDND
jgi:AraC-like DNA-binding protein